MTSLAGIHPWRVTVVMRETGETSMGTAIAIDEGEEQWVLVVDDETRRATWILMQLVKWDGAPS